MSLLSVVIPSYRRVDRLLSVVPLYLEQGPLEVVVVLDGPHADRHLLDDLLADDRVRIVELRENRGLALARIVGLRAAKGDAILMADDDVEPGPEVLSVHQRHLERADVVVGYMPVRVPVERTRDASPTYLYALEYENATLDWERDPATILNGLWNGNVSIRREIYEAAGSSPR